ncbi:MAG: inorganic phosphate transporter, partial [Anaerolineae bacterium]|nr:inorganic phosphate transporter [Anaerolineae bacterium]NIN98519.1 inorganic phosphate transporter [Anaerolineae bacterium]NIQ81417.1 inorganic phosphate transporter [Anaerolineae bacterium]
FLLVLTLAYANGANDVSKAVATLVGSGVTNYRNAILWGTSWTMAGAAASAFVTHTLVKTFSQGLVRENTVLQPSFASAVVTGAMVWVLFASRTGLPVSTTHALTGALVGTGLVAVGGEALIWPEIMKKIVLPLLLSPFLALTCSFLIHPTVRLLARRWEGTCLCLMPTARALVAIDAHGATRTLFQAPTFGQPVVALPSRCDRANLRGLTMQLDTLHWFSSGVASFARGTNDAPKIVAMLLLGTTTASWPSAWSQFVAFGGVAIAMGLGSYVGGLRVTEVLAEKVTTMNHTEGLSANLTTSSLVLIAGTLGLPVSTTHLSGSAIIGIGLHKGRRGVHWVTVRDIIFAWFVTLPVAALVACLVFLMLARSL